MRPPLPLRRLAACFLVVAGGLLSHASAAELLLNGSFESPVVTAVTQGAPTNWAANGNEVFLVPNSPNGSLAQTPYGQQYVGLGSGGAISQTLSGLTPGTNYQLTIAVVNDSGATNSQLGISVSGSATVTYTVTLSSTSQTTFQTYGVQFVPASNGLATVTYSDLGSYSFGIDNASLVPEPASWACLAVGVGLVGGVMVRRRRVA